VLRSKRGYARPEGPGIAGESQGGQAANKPTRSAIWSGASKGTSGEFLRPEVLRGVLVRPHERGGRQAAACFQGWVVSAIAAALND
jgi:hypothetical protein